MTRKDYIKLAAALHLTLHQQLNDDPAYADAINTAAANIADVLQADNARFDRDRFLTAVREGR